MSGRRPKNNMFPGARLAFYSRNPSATVVDWPWFDKDLRRWRIRVRFDNGEELDAIGAELGKSARVVFVVKEAS